MKTSQLSFNILLVDDEPADAHLVRSALKESTVSSGLHHALDGVDAMSFLADSGDANTNPRPDLILLDLNMPRMNGREFLAAIKSEKSLASIPVVVLTSSEVERDVVASYDLGAAGFITKPMDMGQFVDTIRELHSYWFDLVRLPANA